MKRWAVKHIPSGHYMPEPTGRGGRGGSHVKPDPDSNNARLFTSLRSAKIYITTYCMGKFVASRGMSGGHPGNDWEVDYYEDISIIAQSDRRREDFEPIELEINLP